MAAAGPQLRDEARERLYRVARPARGPAVLTREAPGRDTVELARSGSSTDLARAMLEDALVKPPGGKLARDLGRFLVTPRGGELLMTGEELAAWLETWQPPLSTIFPRRRQRWPALLSGAGQRANPPWPGGFAHRGTGSAGAGRGKD